MSMKKPLSLLAVGAFVISSAHAAIVFNPAIGGAQNLPTGTFSGSGTSVFGNYFHALVWFDFTANPIPLTAPFSITGITLSGPGITGSLSFQDIPISANSRWNAGLGDLTTSIPSVDLANTSVSFVLPGGNAISDGTEFTVNVEYANVSFSSRVVSTDGPTFLAQGAGPEPIPEPGTWAAAALLIGGAAFARWRRRKTA